MFARRIGVLRAGRLPFATTTVGRQRCRTTGGADQQSFIRADADPEAWNVVATRAFAAELRRAAPSAPARAGVAATPPVP